MDELMLWLGGAVQGSTSTALVAAFAWGITSVILSPCHLGMIPLIVAYVGSMERPEAAPAPARVSCKNPSPIGAAVLGLVLGIGLSPCTFAFLAPVAGVSFGSAMSNPLFGAALLLAFGVGHCGVIGLAGTSAGAVQRYLDWNERSWGLKALKATCGVLLLASASVLVYTA